jgi:hypothetical protein
VLVFREKVPERLRRHLIVAGETAGTVVETPSQEIDYNESLSLRSQMVLLGPTIVAQIRLGTFCGLSSFLDTTLPRELLQVAVNDFFDSDVPIACTGSTQCTSELVEAEAWEHAKWTVNRYRD